MTRAEAAGADERRLMTGALRSQGLLAVPLVAGAAWVAGAPGALGAATGSALVTGVFAGSAALLWLLVRARPGVAVWSQVVGLAARLVAYAAVLTWLDGQVWVHPPSLAVAVGLGVAVTLAYELRLLARSPRLFWIHPQSDRPTAAASTTTRSPSL